MVRKDFQMKELLIYTIILIPFRALILWGISNILGLDERRYITPVIIISICSGILILANILQPKGFISSIFINFLQSGYLLLPVSFFLIKLLYKIEWKDTIWTWLIWLIAEIPLIGILKKLLIKFIS